MSESSSSDKPRTIGQGLFDWFSGFGLATVLLLLMGLLTWFATLEQIDSGLHATLLKYFHWKSWYLIPEIKGKIVGIPLYCDAEFWGMHFKWSWTLPGTGLDAIPLVLPGGYWVGALLVVNLTLGGVVRARKGWKHAGNLIAHCGIILMLVAGGVAHHFEERGNMVIHPGTTNDVAEAYTEYVVEVAEIDDSGMPSTIHVIRGKHLTDLEGANSRTFRMPGVPFELEIAGYVTHAAPVHIHQRAPQNKEREVDGYYLLAGKPEIDAERNVAGCYARVKTAGGDLSAPFILSGQSFHPFTVEDQGRTFTIHMRKRLWPMPFALRLDKFNAEFHPGTHKPSKFVSKVTRIEQGSEAPFTIQMNEPMRYGGLTFFQASYGPQDGTPVEEMYTVLEVVDNPADKWPEISLYIVTVGMLIAFVTKLVQFLMAQSRKRAS